MPTIEDELGRIMDVHSAGDRPSVDRRAAVERRIVRHRRQRAALAAGAVALVLAITGGALAISGRHRAAPHPPTNTPPGPLPAYAFGGKLVASASGHLPDHRTVSFTFTPTTWDFTIGDRCDSAPTQWLSIKVNGNAYVGTQCGPHGSVGNNAPEFDQYEQFWTSMGVRPGEPTTVTATILPDAHESPVDYGMIAIGAYVAVPFDQYPISPRPTDAPTALGGIQGSLGRPLLTITGGTATSETRQFTMPARIEVMVDMIVPGLVSVYIDDVQVAECDSWNWYGQGCGTVEQIVGSDRLSRFTLGQAVTVTVVTRHVTGTGTWRVILNGR